MAEAVRERPKRKTKVKKPKERENQLVIQDRDKRSSQEEIQPIAQSSDISKAPNVETTTIFPQSNTLSHDAQTTSIQSKSLLHDAQPSIQGTAASGTPVAESEKTGSQSKALLHDASSSSQVELNSQLDVAENLNWTAVTEPVIPKDSYFLKNGNQVGSKLTTDTDETESDSMEKENIKTEESSTCEGQSKSETRKDITPEVTDENKLKHIDGEKRMNEYTVNLTGPTIDACAKVFLNEHSSCEAVKTFRPVLYPDLQEEKAKMLFEIQMEQKNMESVPSEHILVQSVTSSEEKTEQVTNQAFQPEAQSTVRTETAPPEELLIQQEQKTINKTPIIQNRERVYNPLTIEQLNSLYYNPELLRNKQFIDNFVLNEQKKESHEFYEILLNYQRSRRSLIQSEEAIKTLEQKYMQTEGEVWLTKTCTITAKGKCGDAAKCQGIHMFEKCEMNSVAFTELKKTLEIMQDHLEKQLSLHSYSAQLSRLQVESYIHNLFMTSPALRNIPRNAPVQMLERHSADTSHQVRKLRECISVLFTFHRRPADDEEFVSNLQSWTERLVSALLRIATFEDHLFILNHILRCSGGVGQWAGHLVQVPPIPSSINQTPPTFGSPILDHLITCLATILIQTEGREEFLWHLRKVFTPETKDEKSITWIMVNVDGEEDEDPQNAWLYLHENDIVTLIRQLPISAIFKHVLFITETDGEGEHIYDICYTSEPAMFRLFAFCTCLLGVFGSGLNTFSMSRYRQLNKRLGRMIRQSVQYVSDHWENFKNANKLSLLQERLNQLQVEFDTFFMRATKVLLSVKGLGAWQFIADMPFSNVSKTTLWQLLWLLFQEQTPTSDISNLPSIEVCKQFIQDAGSKSQLCDVLQLVSQSEAIYLLTAMTNITESCTLDNEDIVQAIILTVFEVAYVCAETRELFSKMGRELLCTVTTRHPSMMSLLTQRVHEVIDSLGVTALYLYKGLPLPVWLPTDPDIVIIRQWLLSLDFYHTISQLAQIILSNFNWGPTNQGDRLVVPWQLHKQIAVLITEAYQKFTMGKNYGSAIMEGMKQMVSGVNQQLTNEQEFNNWCWDLLLKLHLHRSSLPSTDQRLADSQSGIPDLSNDDALLPISKGIKEKNPVACAAALLLTKYGHDVSSFLEDGLPVLHILVEQYHFRPILCILYYTVPLYYECPQYLLQNDRFRSVLQAMLQADESYFKMAQSLLSYEFPGPVTKLFLSMIQSQISVASSDGEEKVFSVLSLWTKLIMSLPKWWQDRNCCCALDVLVKSSFAYKGMADDLIRIFKVKHELFLSEEKPQGLVTSLMSWVTSGVTFPSFMEKWSFPEFSWLAYVILHVEGLYEEQTKLWSMIQEELLSSAKIGIDQALKKSIMKLKMDQAPVLNRLNIYRWLQQALDMPKDHPTLFLCAHRFFVLFLGRLTSQGSLPQRASVGEKFFSSMTTSSMLKKLKKKLGEAADFYMKQDEGSGSLDIGPPEEGGTQTGIRHVQLKLARIFQTFQLWLDEPRLHDASLYLPALPSQYQSDRLLQVFQNQINPWLEFLPVELIKGELSALAFEWKQMSHQKFLHKKSVNLENRETDLSPTERILLRIKKHDLPLPPPNLVPLKAPVPDISPSIMDEKASILHLLEGDLNNLTVYARSFCSKMEQSATLDFLYLELLSKLYTNVPRQVTVKLQCRSVLNPMHKCSNPGTANVQIKEKTMDHLVSQHLKENRAEFKQLMIDSQLPPPQYVCISAVHVENAITMLVKMFRSCTDEKRRARLNNIACTLFFKMAEMISENILKYPPTKQFFSFCIDILGQEFIQLDPSQTHHVLALTLEQSSLVGFLARHFVPNISLADYVTLYEILMQTMQKGNTDVTFMLLTKFDLANWLTTHKPTLNEARQFMEILGKALTHFGMTPKDKEQRLFEIYLGHEKILLRHNFPLYLNDVIGLILQGSSLEKLHLKCWEALHNQCFHYEDVETSPQVDAGAPSSECGNVHTRLSTEEVVYILKWFGGYFSKLRLSSKSYLSFGLYPSWTKYVPYISKLLRDFLKCFIDKMLPNLPDIVAIQGFEPIWLQIIEVFQPWVQPVTGLDGVASPWIESDKPVAVQMVMVMTEVIRYAHEKTQAFQQKVYMDFLSLLWMYFANTLSNESVPNHVISLYNTQFCMLPWKQLQPNQQVMDSMTKLKQSSHPSSFILLADIVSAIDWMELLQFYKTYQSTDSRRDFEACLFMILMQCYGEKKHLENQEIERLLIKAETCSWENLTVDSYLHVCSCFLQDAEPACLFASRSSSETLGLRLLKSASGFNVQASSTWSEDLSVKRQNYLHCVAQLFCQSTYEPLNDKDALSIVLINLLTEIETVEGAVVDRYHQQQETIDMVKEVFSLLNNCNPEDGSTTIVMTTIIQWLQGSPHSILLQPCIHAASRTLASLSHMTKIVEECIHLHFESGEKGSKEDGWDMPLRAMQIPELDLTKFFDICLQEGSFLLLYCYILHKFPLCQNLIEEQGLMKLMMDWTEAAKPSAENEAKLLLWWYKILQLQLRHIDFGRSLPVCVTVLNNFVHIIKVYGEERSSSGLLGAIGLGRKSSLSQNELPYILTWKSNPTANNIDPNLPSHTVRADQGLCSWFYSFLLTNCIDPELLIHYAMADMGLWSLQLDWTYKFLVIARSIAAFCTAQIQNESSLRVQPGDPHIEGLTSKAPVQALLSLRGNRKYQTLKGEVELACGFVLDQSRTLRDVLKLLQELTKRLYYDTAFLSLIHKDGHQQ